MKLTTWECSFKGKRIGAMGRDCYFTVMIHAEDEDAARLQLYDTFEHLSKVVITKWRVKI